MLRMAIPETVRLTQRDNGGSLWVNADSNRIEQIVLNLVVNARDAMPEGGEIVITTGSRTIEEGGRIPPGKYALLSVEDTGTGMDEELVGRIFEPFFTTKDRKSGTGLGLSTVYGIVQEMGGHVEVTSEVGRGTTFEIVVPLVDAPAPAAASEKAAEVHAGTETILVVEDERAVAAIIERILLKAGYEPLVAHSGKEALVMIGERTDIDLVITDAVMPGMSGQELVERIPSLPVLFISGYTEKMDALAASGNFLPKPFTPDDLLEAVHRALATPVAV
jgi:two-component system cell cycle sensor histidine kinase/response regulator CckA